VQTGLFSAEQMDMPPAVAVAVFVPFMIVLSAIPAILHGVVFAYLWTVSGSLAVVTFYHLAYDGVRDSMGITIGGGAISAPWVTVALSILGIMLLWKGKWKFENIQKTEDPS
jgi:hypothetical protein